MTLSTEPRHCYVYLRLPEIKDISVNFTFLLCLCAGVNEFKDSHGNPVLRALSSIWTQHFLGYSVSSKQRKAKQSEMPSIKLIMHMLRIFQFIHYI